MIAVITLAILVAGFLFTSQNPITNFKQSRISGWSLYCHLFVWGLIFSLTDAVLLYFITKIKNEYIVNSLDYFSNVFESDKKLLCLGDISFYFVLWILSFIFIAYLFGLLFSKLPFLKNIALKRICKANDLKNKLFEASNHTRLIQITMNSRKVYVGFVFRNKDEIEYKDKEYVELIPYKSGYRDEKNLKICFLNEYSGFYYRYMKENKLYLYERFKRICQKKKFKYIIFKLKYYFKLRKLNLNLERYLKNFSVIVPMEDIISVSYFKKEIYSKVNGNIDSNSLHFSVTSDGKVKQVL